MIKKFILRFLFWIGISLLFFVAYLVYIVNDANSVSKGLHIHPEERTETILFVIDIQEGITGEIAPPSVYVDQSPELIESVNKLVSIADSLNIPIVYIQQQTNDWFLNWADDYVLAKGTPGVELDGRLKILSANFFPKRKSDAFSNLRLDPFLEVLKVKRIVISGLDIAYCAGKTSQAALNRGYEVVIVEDAVISESDELKQEKIMELETAGARIINIDQLPGLLAKGKISTPYQ